jgi:hypothetical protein
VWIDNTEMEFSYFCVGRNGVYRIKTIKKILPVIGFCEHGNEHPSPQRQESFENLE